MSATYSQLLSSKVHWVPFNVTREKLDTVNSEMTEGVYKALALALALEMPVGEWVGDAINTPTFREALHPSAISLLKSNIKDETNHYRAFKILEGVYPEVKKYNAEAMAIHQQWDALSSHPLAKSCYAETGVFLISLAVLMLYGGNSIANLAQNVSKDEQIHVATNNNILSILGLDGETTTSSINKLRQETLYWLLGDFEDENLGLDFDFFNEQSNLLIKHQSAPELSELTTHHSYTPPFEHRNAILY